MTRHETACALGATVLTSAGTATAFHHLWWETSVFWALAFFLAEGAIRERRARQFARVVKRRHPVGEVFPSVRATHTFLGP